MNIQLTNTLTRRKEPFVPADPKRVTLYVCGPTVYNYAHIGNMRPPVVFDVLFRLLRHTYGDDAVIYARNYTDIDDRIIAQAVEKNVPIGAITEQFERAYEEDTGALGVLKPTLTPRATQNVDGMIALIQKLIDNGKAYLVGSGVYFDVRKSDDYGKLSRRNPDDLTTESRIEAESDKNDPADFALWKTAKPGEPSWDAPFGAGRPGWHIECSAMIEAELGSPIDIHGGGIDLIFPHHENEIAQSESAHGHPLARVWMHNGFLTMDAAKMSKSLGNIITPRELLEQGWQGETLRWALLSAHYKAPLDWSEDLMRQAQASLDRLYGALLRLKDVDAIDNEAPQAFIDALADDLNTPAAIAELSALATAANIAKKPIEQAQAKGQLQAAAKLLGVLQNDPEHWFRASFGDAAAEIDQLVAARVTARTAKNYAESDRLRDELAARGVEVMDGATGSTWRRKG
ncbi:cysteine--tRNA ligase [Terricaulis silvestris]|uniref:Cysteine--tRNA ligase n=1 Tax=Terricaulis silvestris TaxID=2686094 RepID=A0A6I6MRS6_9CAUL|nr:cysteine--tRNA ligase [Terricaulis silvestris]QGZ94342.1 Cysteine--tRNA ligase [Terricaulis silvestris]